MRGKVVGVRIETRYPIRDSPRTSDTDTTMPNFRNRTRGETDDAQLMNHLYPLKTNYWFDGGEPT